MRRHRKRRKIVSEINVVPYIDVMLVLLIIFMVTAPMMNLGVDIDLPKGIAEPLDQKDEPLLVSVDKEGVIYLTKGGGQREAMDEKKLVMQVAAIVAQTPKTAVLIAADQTVPYGNVYKAMELMQQAQVTRVSFISEPLAAK
jgi:biopolymer transport protein TolR